MPGTPKLHYNFSPPAGAFFLPSLGTSLWKSCLRRAEKPHLQELRLSAQGWAPGGSSAVCRWTSPFLGCRSHTVSHDTWQVFPGGKMVHYFYFKPLTSLPCIPDRSKAYIFNFLEITAEWKMSFWKSISISWNHMFPPPHSRKYYWHVLSHFTPQTVWFLYLWNKNIKSRVKCFEVMFMWVLVLPVLINCGSLDDLFDFFLHLFRFLLKGIF